MSFDDMPPQTPYISAAAQNYARNINAWSREAVAASRCVLDLPYGPNYWQKIDIFLPKHESTTNLPVFLYLHGGGWRRGYKEEMGFMAPQIVSLPAIFVSVSYRLVPEVNTAEQIDDTISAIELVRNTAPQYGGNPDKLAIGGHSAGAHLATMATLRPDLLTARGLPADAIKYCFPVSGPFEIGPGGNPDEVKEMLGGSMTALEASPITYVEGNKVPFYITWASNDLQGMLLTSEPMIEALRKNGSRVDSHIFEGMDHFDISMAHGKADNIWVQTVRQRLAEM
jgi:acetyl esterase/lipase